MITIHHLNMSRSDRAIWLAEELGIEYEIVNHERGPDFRSPKSLWEVHPMGKAPIIIDAGKKVFESGAIVEYLIDKYGNGKLKPATGTEDYINYLHWMHAAESTLMTPILFKFLGGAMGMESEGMNGFIDGEFKTVFIYMNDVLSKHRYIAAQEFTGADIMVGYPLSMAENMDPKPYAEYQAITDYVARLKERPAYQRAAEKF